MRALEFTVPGAARGKGRPRATTIGGHARMFTDAKTASYENLVRMAAVDALGDRPPFAEAVAVSITVRMTPPKGTSRPKLVAMLSGSQRPAKRPDLDNVVKAVTDGCNAVAYTDDALIVCLWAYKIYAETAGVDVRIELVGVNA